MEEGRRIKKMTAVKMLARNALMARKKVFSQRNFKVEIR